MLDLHRVSNPISHVVHVGNLSLVPTRMKQHLHSREVLVIQDRLARPSSWVTSFSLPHDSLGVEERDFGQVVTQLHYLTGPISPACDRYIQYLLTGINPSVFNRHRWELPHRNLRIATALFQPFPFECSTGPPIWLHPVPILSDINHRFQGSSLKGHVAATWSSNHLAIYCNLHLRLAIANELSLAIRSTRVDWKVSLMQL
jgi:hypothetical protein